MEYPVFSVQYFGNILFYYLINQHPAAVLIENSEYYVKQTLRNRTYILTANGIMPLIIPVVHKSNKELISEKEICYKEKWHKKHYTAIVSAYKKSPYFEYYADDLLDFLQYPKEQNLFQLNIQIMNKIFSLLNIHTETFFTDKYQNHYNIDYRSFFDNQYELPSFLKTKYLQVFSDRFEFQQNLSILDLIFNLGPSAQEYIKEKFKM